MVQGTQDGAKWQGTLDPLHPLPAHPPLGLPLPFPLLFPLLFPFLMPWGQQQGGEGGKFLEVSGPSAEAVLQGLIAIGLKYTLMSQLYFNVLSVYRECTWYCRMLLMLSRASFRCTCGGAAQSGDCNRGGEGGRAVVPT